jgi:hypothetical protein
MGIEIKKSKIYRSRYEVICYGKHSFVKTWIRDTFGDADDMVWDSDDGDEHYTGYDALITEEQAMLVKLKFL